MSMNSSCPATYNVAALRPSQPRSAPSLMREMVPKEKKAGVNGERGHTKDVMRMSPMDWDFPGVKAWQKCLDKGHTESITSTVPSSGPKRRSSGFPTSPQYFLWSRETLQWRGDRTFRHHTFEKPCEACLDENGKNLIFHCYWVNCCYNTIQGKKHTVNRGYWQQWF